MEITYPLTDITEVAKQVLNLRHTNILLFYGEMGVGKTTLIKELVRLLGIDEITSSPTFSLVNEYRSTSELVYHFDFYRIDNEEEALDIGIEDYFYSNGICLVEWPNKIESLLPENSTKITITKNDNDTRTLSLS